MPSMHVHVCISELSGVRIVLSRDSEQAPSRLSAYALSRDHLVLFLVWPQSAAIGHIMCSSM